MARGRVTRFGFQMRWPIGVCRMSLSQKRPLANGWGLCCNHVTRVNQWRAAPFAGFRANGEIFTNSDSYPLPHSINLITLNYYRSWWTTITVIHSNPIKCKWKRSQNPTIWFSVLIGWMRVERRQERQKERKTEWKERRKRGGKHKSRRAALKKT